MITIMKRSLLSLNGRVTASLVRLSADGVVKNKVVHALSSSNYWSSSEVSATNAWNINFSNGTVNNNKNNAYVVRAVAALGEEEKIGWIEAFTDCCRHKMSSVCCTDYRMVMEDDLWILMYEVHYRLYKPSESICFVVTRPRLREIFAANFRDRIVQHWIILRVNPILEERFVEQGNVSFNCRKGYGTLLAVSTLEREIIRVSDGYTKEAYIGKFDIQSFFMSINKEILISLLIPYISERYHGEDKETLIWVTELVIRHCPQKLCVKRSPAVLMEQLPKHKRLEYSDDGTGMPIGNITSQILANFYLSFFDDFMIAECKKVDAGYIRFVDDFAVVSTDKQFILDIHKNATEWLQKNLKLKLHADKFYLQDVKKGVKFVGSVIKPFRTYTSKETVGRMMQLLDMTEWVCRYIHDCGLDALTAKRLEHCVCGLNSYMGFLCHTSSYALRRKMFADVFYFWKVCYMEKRFATVKIRNKYKYHNFLINKTNYELQLRNRKTRNTDNGSQIRATSVHRQRVHRSNRRRESALQMAQRDTTASSMG